MSSVEEQWWSVRAGEYVLGTLRGRDLELFEKILNHDTAVQREVDRWAHWLSALNESTIERQPGDHLWPRILAKVRRARALARNPTSRTDDAIDLDRPLGEVPMRGSSGRVHHQRFGMAPATRVLVRSSLLWPSVAAVATAASLLLAILMSQQLTNPQPTFSIDGVTVVLSEQGSPLWLLQADYDPVMIRATALAPLGTDETQDYQLWQVLPDGEGANPVGLLPTNAGDTAHVQPDRFVQSVNTLAVSLEPVGGSLKPGPSGPVLYQATLVPTGI